MLTNSGASVQRANATSRTFRPNVPQQRSSCARSNSFIGFLNSGHLQRVSASNANEAPVERSTIGWKTTSKSPTAMSRTDDEMIAGAGSLLATGLAMGCVVDVGRSLPTAGGRHVTASWIAVAGGFEKRRMRPNAD